MKQDPLQNIPTLSEAKAYIDAIDFSNIINKMVNRQKWSQRDAQSLCQMYRNFLYLNRKYGTDNVLPPSQEIDEFWHNHILDTQHYRKDCEHIFGTYLDHHPIDSKDDSNDLILYFATTKSLYLQEFGVHLNKIRTTGLMGLLVRVLKVIDGFKDSLAKIFYKPASIRSIK